MPSEGEGGSQGHSLTDVSTGRIAAVVTHLEMLAPPADLSTPASHANLVVERVTMPDTGWYRGIYRAVGENWLWYTRLAMDDAELAATIRQPGIEIYRLAREDADIGLLELDFRFWPDVELVFFGVVADAIGTGAALLLMRYAIERAWRDAPKRFWVHTCTLDHPRALRFYERNGFRAYKREIEIDDDPRLTGVLPRSAAPWYPVIE